MAKILNLDEYRVKTAEQRGFTPWRKRFQTVCTRRTTPADLDDQMLYALAVPGENSTAAYFELVMGVFNLGPAARFYDLEKTEQIKVTDVHLFLADQVRFELMRRLGWVAGFPCQKIPLLELVLQSGLLSRACRERPPDLSADHPAYADYRRMVVRDREVFVRRLLGDALTAFERRLQE